MNLKKYIKIYTKKLFQTFIAILFVTISSVANNTDPADKKDSKKSDDTIVTVATSNENFTTLVAAVKAAGLVDVLNSEGPFTVFAPINDAFGKLPEGTVGTLLKPENKKLLTSILTYHVVAGEFKANDMLKAIKDNNRKFTIKTVQGNSLTASLKDGNVILTDVKGNISTIVITDVAASNGIVHAIDTAVMPE